MYIQNISVNPCRKGYRRLETSFYTASVAAQQQQYRLDIHGNNIANINTYGYRTKVPSFVHLMTQQIRNVPSTGGEDDENANADAGQGNGVTTYLSTLSFYTGEEEEGAAAVNTGEEEEGNAENDVPDMGWYPRGVGSRMIGTAMRLDNGGVLNTGRGYDYAIDGNGFFKLLDPATGEVSYTRDGSFTRSMTNLTDEDGNILWYLSDGNGRFVIGQNNQPIPLQDADSESYMLPVGIFGFENYDGLRSLSENRVQPTEKNGNELLVGNSILLPRCLEYSNTDLAYELSKVIETQRSYSMMLKMISTSDDIESTVNSLRS